MASLWPIVINCGERLSWRLIFETIGTPPQPRAPMQKHIAIVEDEAAIAANYRDHLQKQGFRVSLYPCKNTAAQAFNLQLPDLAIIDVGLGHEMDGGFELCRELRTQSPLLPIVFLTARDSELDIISGLRLGADEYLSKDISQVQLSARINALLRRVDAMRAPEQQQDLLRRGELELNRERMTTNWRGQALELTVTEFWMVYTLALHPGHVKNRQQLMDQAKVVLDDNTITSHIKRIRRKFQAVDSDFQHIETAYGMGYRWKG